MQVHLIDGTYEMYRQHYGSAIRDREPPPFAGTIGVLSSTIQLLAEGATHIGVATDHVIESFRNDLYDGYKTSEGMEPVLLEQIPIIENALRAMGVTVWAMEKHEADDALASAVAVACEDRRVHQVRILTPDKDLGQCVSGRRVVQVDRRNNLVLDENEIRKKFGVDLAIATTGIAGPGGGTKEKPVGFVYIAVSSANAQLCKSFRLFGNREQIIQRSSNAALWMVKQLLKMPADSGL